jgi:hypothetical protein
MLLKRVFEKVIEKTPVSVMFRGVLENALSAAEVDSLFLGHSRTGYLRKLLFSQMVDLMGMVVTRIHPRIHAAYLECREALGVGIDSVYDKLQRIEPQVSAALVAHVGRKLSTVIDCMEGAMLPPILPGYPSRILDGKHLNGTQRRPKSTRRLNSVPLPGQLLVVLDAERMLATQVVPCEDAHAQERALVQEILPAVRPGEIWIADRNFCTTRFVFGVAERGGFFLVRRHRSTLHIENQEDWTEIGRTETGLVFEAGWRILDDSGCPMDIRAIRVLLDKPTRDGDKEIVVLTNLPAQVGALQIAPGYLHRWTVEIAFGEISAVLAAEIDTMAYPRAALFGFCVGVIAYNILATIKGALRAVHGVEKVKKVSTYHLAREIHNRWEGIDIIVEDHHWTNAFAALSPQQLAKRLIELATTVKLDKFPKHPRGPKKKVHRRTTGGRFRHVATARLLAQQRTAQKSNRRKQHT